MKEQVVKSVGDLFQKYGIRSVSMDDIAHELKISKKTIYQYFEDKNQLVQEVAGWIISDKLGSYRDATECASNAIEELVDIAKLIREHFSEMNPAFMYDVKKYYPQAWELFENHERDVIYNSIIDNIKRGQKEGFFRTDLNAPLIAKIRFEQIHLTFDETVFPKDEYNLQAVHLELFDFFVHGVLTAHGLEQYKNYTKHKNE